jgi:hypothetical protein
MTTHLTHHTDQTAHANPSDRTQPLAERILDAFPSGSYALSGLLRLLDIVETDSVPTAAVECRLQPRMLVNPAFVDAHAQSPEKLLMLVMHELHHVLLGHTTLFPRVTTAQNFVFDAVINGILCRMFPAPEYTAFFTDYYRADRFPECLLRPPPGWPNRTRGLTGAWNALSAQISRDALNALDPTLRARVLEVHEALYSETGASYHEVYELLPQLLVVLGPQALTGVPLLGGHDAQSGPDGGSDRGSDSTLQSQSPLLFDIVRELVEQWPQPPDPIRGRSLAEVLKQQSVDSRPVPTNRVQLQRLIRKVAGVQGPGRLNRQQAAPVETMTPLPSLSRRSLVLQALGHTPLLHPGVVPWRRRVRSGEQVHVYLDVSGSMNSVLGALYGAVLDCQALVHPQVHLFSSKVVDVTLADLRAGRCSSTGGTDIGCVAEHMQRHRVRRAVMITDGWVGQPRGEHRQTLSRCRLGVALLGDNANPTDLEAFARHTTKLSSLSRPAGTTSLTSSITEGAFV